MLGSSLLAKLDAACIDRVFQPLVDHTAAWWSPYTAARVTLGAYFVCATINPLTNSEVGPVWWRALLGVFPIAMSAISFKMINLASEHADSGKRTMNPARRFSYPIRMWQLISLPVNLFFLSFEVLEAPFIGNVALFVSLYLTACRPHPPIRHQMVWAL